MKNKLAVTFMVIFIALSVVSCSPKDYQFEVDMQEFKFTPSSFTVPAGTQVTLNLTNSGALEHEFVIMNLGKEATIPFDDDDEANVYWEAELAPGAKETVTFTAPAVPGEYQIVCGTPGHLEQAMKGVFTVTQK